MSNLEGTSGPADQEWVSREILRVLSVTGVSADQFTGTCLPAWPGRAFGGQLAAQSLLAAGATVDPSFHPWSLHGHFHAPVRSLEPVTYEVTRVKDGRSLASRQVRVMQDDKLRVTVLALFGIPSLGPEYQAHPPEVPRPEELTSEAWLLDPTIVSPDADFDALGYPAQPLVETRIATEPGIPGRHVWMRLMGHVPDDPLITAAALCGLADLTLGTTALEPHGGRAATMGLQLGAVELAMWFTAPARLSEWTLFAQNTAFSGGGHGLAHGTFFNSDGKVAAIAAQNALMRNPPQ